MFAMFPCGSQRLRALGGQISARICKIDRSVIQRPHRRSWLRCRAEDPGPGKPAASPAPKKRGPRKRAADDAKAKVSGGTQQDESDSEEERAAGAPQETQGLEQQQQQEEEVELSEEEEVEDEDDEEEGDEEEDEEEEDGDDEEASGPIGMTPLLSAQEVAVRLYDAVHPGAAAFFKSFYSSVYGGIVTDVALFMLPIDDHMVHRGHGVFDTAIMVQGNLYQLDAHLERFFQSAEAARIPLAAEPEVIRRIVLDTAAASRCPNGFLRYWMSAGRGGFSLSGYETFGSEFYCVCYNGPHPDMDETKGWVIKTTPVPNKPAYFAELKSVNYLQNALNLMDAEDCGMELGVFVREDGTICEGPTANIGIITQEGVLKVPPFEGCLAGCIMTRIMELVPGFARENLLEGIVGVVQDHIQLEEAYLAREVFVAGGAIPVAAVTEWDQRIIGDGKVGVGVLALRQMIMNDMTPDGNPYGKDQLTPVPYGILTGMIEDALDL